MNTRPPPVDPRDPVSLAGWATWMSDRFVWIVDQLEHLHACVERKADEAAELSESRHQQNINALGEVRDAVRPLTMFMENATKDELVKGAVAGERARVRTKAQKRRAAAVRLAAEAGKILVGAGVLTGLLHLVGL